MPVLVAVIVALALVGKPLRAWVCDSPTFQLREPSSQVSSFRRCRSGPQVLLGAAIAVFLTPARLSRWLPRRPWWPRSLSRRRAARPCRDAVRLRTDGPPTVRRICGRGGADLHAGRSRHQPRRGGVDRGRFSRPAADGGRTRSPPPVLTAIVMGLMWCGGAEWNGSPGDCHAPRSKTVHAGTSSPRRRVTISFKRRPIWWSVPSRRPCSTWWSRAG